MNSFQASNALPPHHTGDSTNSQYSRGSETPSTPTPLRVTLPLNFPFTLEVAPFPFPRTRSQDQSSMVRPHNTIHHKRAKVLSGLKRNQEFAGVAEVAADEFMKIWKINRFVELKKFRISYNKRKGTHIANSTIARLVRIKKLKVGIERMQEAIREQEAAGKLGVGEARRATATLATEIEKLEKAKSSSRGEKNIVENAREVLWGIEKLVGPGIVPNIPIANAAKIFSLHKKRDPLLKETQFLKRYALSFSSEIFHEAVQEISDSEKEAFHNLQKEEAQKRNSISISLAALPQKRARLIATATPPQIIWNDLPLDLSLKAPHQTERASSEEDLPLDLSLKKNPATDHSI